MADIAPPIIEVLTPFDLTNGNWTYSNDGSSITIIDETLRTTDTWTLTGNTSKIFIFDCDYANAKLGNLVIYTNGNLDTYGYASINNKPTSINSSGQPDKFDYKDDDSGDNYGASYNQACGLSIPLNINTNMIYFLVRPYTASNSGDVSVSYKVVHPKIDNVYLKTASNTWKKI